jgi:ParB-like chromosome segregation protein Spo0J
MRHGIDEGTMSAKPIAIHPIAALFPMLGEEELADLAADIKAQGLLNPIILDDGGMLIDGRNRLKACEIAGVEPRFAKLDGHDPVAFILAQNTYRRHMSRGALAMVTARALRLTGSGKSQNRTAKDAGINQQRISEAFTVLDFASDLADGVIDGTITLDAAHHQATERKRAKRFREIELQRLKETAPDLAARVAGDNLSLEEARTLVQERDRVEANLRDSVYLGLTEAVRHSASFLKSSGLEKLPDWFAVEAYDDEFKRRFEGGLIPFAKEIERARAGLERASEFVKLAIDRRKENAKKARR